MFCNFIASKANQKLSALSRMAVLLSFNKRKTIFKAFSEVSSLHKLNTGEMIALVPFTKFQ